MSLHYYTARLEVIDISQTTDTSPQDFRSFTITSGPYRDVYDAIESTEYDFVLRFDGVDCVAIVGVYKYEIDFVETNIKEWSPHNLDDVLCETLYRGIRTTEG